MAAISFKNDQVGSLNWDLPKELTDRIGRLPRDEQAPYMDSLSNAMQGTTLLVAGIYCDPDPRAQLLYNEAMRWVSDRLVELKKTGS